ncbi:MAG: hypothetical protein V1841_02140 [Patescibacteria group bacterium]
MKTNPNIFRAYDIRGIYKKDFDEESFKKIGFILGKTRERFLVGNDIRESGASLSKALISGLLSGGARVVSAGTGSLGQILFSGLKSKTDKTLFITASHLTPEWNGLKPYFGDGEPLSQETIESIRDQVAVIKDGTTDTGETAVEKVDFKREYLNFLLDKFPLIKNNNLKVVLDCGNGSMSLATPEIFKAFGFNVIELFCQPDSSFPNRPSEPTIPATKVLREKVIAEKADFGVAFDGDGDRGIIIDDKGKYLTGNQVGIILGKDIVPQAKEKKVVQTIACSMSVREELRSVGARIIEVPVGNTYVISTCKKEKACIGIEETGHIVMTDYFLFDDAILIPLKIAEIILKARKRLSDLVSQIRIYPFEGEIPFQCDDEIKFDIIKKLTRDFKKKFNNVNTLDGVKVNFGDSWILIRPSNTSPKVNFYVEARTQEKFNTLKQEFNKILQEKICKQ